MYSVDDCICNIHVYDHSAVLTDQYIFAVFSKAAACGGVAVTVQYKQKFSFARVATGSLHRTRTAVGRMHLLTLFFIIALTLLAMTTRFLDELPSTTRENIIENHHRGKSKHGCFRVGAKEPWSADEDAWLVVRQYRHIRDKVLRPQLAGQRERTLSAYHRQYQQRPDKKHDVTT